MSPLAPALFIDYRGKTRAPRTESERRMAAAQAEARTACLKGCPRCGHAVRRNLSIKGWVQCGQFGAPGFRVDASVPACSWQGFTR